MNSICNYRISVGEHTNIKHSQLFFNCGSDFKIELLDLLYDDMHCSYLEYVTTVVLYNHCVTFV